MWLQSIIRFSNTKICYFIFHFAVVSSSSSFLRRKNFLITAFFFDEIVSVRFVPFNGIFISIIATYENNFVSFNLMNFTISLSLLFPWKICSPIDLRSKFIKSLLLAQRNNAFGKSNQLDYFVWVRISFFLLEWKILFVVGFFFSPLHSSNEVYKFSFRIFRRIEVFLLLLYVIHSSCSNTANKSWHRD